MRFIASTLLGAALVAGAAIGFAAPCHAAGQGASLQITSPTAGTDQAGPVTTVSGTASGSTCVQLFDNGVTPTNWTAPVAGGTWTITLPHELTTGQHTLFVTDCQDRGVNAEAVFTVGGSTAPAVPALNAWGETAAFAPAPLPDGEKVTSLSGTATYQGRPLGGTCATVSDGNTVLLSAPTDVLDFNVPADGTITATGVDLADGTHRIYVSAGSGVCPWKGAGGSTTFYYDVTIETMPLPVPLGILAIAAAAIAAVVVAIRRGRSDVTATAG
jgi:hypothetical protein